MSIDNRIKHVRSAQLCLNCLRAGHQANICRGSGCKKCNKKHNTLLHQTPPQTPIKATEASSSDSDSPPGPSTSITSNIANTYEQPHVLLSTAIVDISDEKGEMHQCRALLDSGSQSNFISSELALKLHLKSIPTNVAVSGIAGNHARIKSSIRTTLSSKQNKFNIAVNCLVLDRVTNNIPTRAINKSLINIPKNLRLADPEFNKPSKIDLLIGAELFWQLLCIGQIKLHNTNLIMQKTRLGWILSGSLNNIPEAISNCSLSVEKALDNK
jgi:hypothetical protein